MHTVARSKCNSRSPADGNRSPTGSRSSTALLWQRGPCVADSDFSRRDTSTVKWQMTRETSQPDSQSQCQSKKIRAKLTYTPYRAHFQRTTMQDEENVLSIRDVSSYNENSTNFLEGENYSALCFTSAIGSTVAESPHRHR